MQSKRLGITWQLSDFHGWGTFGLNLALELIERGPCPPLLFQTPVMIDMPDRLRAKLQPFVDEQDAMMSKVKANGQQAVLNDTTVLHSLANQFTHSPVSDLVRGRANIGFIFFEDASLDEAAIARAHAYDRILVGSSWNLDVLEGKGVAGAAFVSQGIDAEMFTPEGREEHDGGCFRVFSGGKLELRKGQDMVVAAFKIFHERHPDSQLVTAWRNAWPETALDVGASPYLDAAPKMSADGDIMIAEWAAANGIPADAFVDLGWISNRTMAGTLRGCDLAVLPSRCEGGTNLVAMEAMACATPCVLSANTGHLDLIDGENCYPLDEQIETVWDRDPAGMWRDSSIDEIVARMEQAYSDRDDARRRGAQGAEFMKNLSWRNQVAQLIDAISDLL